MARSIHYGKLLLAVLFAAITAVSAGNDAGLSVLQARQFTTHQGLSNNEVTRIIQNNTGYIWIGTESGLNRFDGYDFSAFRIGSTGNKELPGNNISALYVDDDQQLWVGSGGLSLYVPETGGFKNWHHIPADDMSLADSYVNAIASDPSGRIWLGSYFGIRILDPDALKFISLIREDRLSVNPATIEYLLKSDAPLPVISGAASLLGQSFSGEAELLEALRNQIDNGSYDDYFPRIAGEALWTWNENTPRSNHITTLVRASDNNIWLVYGHEGLSSIDPETMEFRHYLDIIDDTRVAVDLINDIAPDSNRVWIATSTEGLKILDLITGKTLPVPLDGEPYIQHLRMEGNDLWIADNRGVLVYNTVTGEYFRKGFLIPNQGIITDFIGKYTFRDVQDNLWVGTSHTGLLMAVATDNFRTVENRIVPPVGNPENAVSAIEFDNLNNLWVGYVKGSIEVFDQNHNKTMVVQSPDPYLPRATDIFAIFSDKLDNIWTGSFDGGADVYNTGGELVRRLHHEGLAGRLPGNDIRDIKVDAKGNVFMAVHGNGIAIIEGKTGGLQVVRHNPEYPVNTILSDWTRALLCDNQGGVWIGSVEGLSYYSTVNGAVRNYRFEETPRDFINIRSIAMDERGLLWLGTEYGAVIFNPAEEKYFRLTMAHGLSNNIIASVLEDHSGNIWISTRNGLNRFETLPGTDDLIGFLESLPDDEMQNHITQYGLADGMLTDVFSFGASARADDGHLYFGSNAGVIWFHPDSLTINQYLPPVIISRLNLFNREVTIDDETGILSRDISHTDRIVLRFNQRVVGFEFHALNYIYPEKNQYAYMMDGFDDDWSYVTDRREATYTNLNPGTYTFIVRAANNSGIWNDQDARIEVVVRPPIWRTNAAYVTYALIVIGLSYLLRQIMLIRTHAKMEVRKAQEIDEIKTDFFTSVSHEFRTPLTLIEGPVEKLMKERERFNWESDFYQVNLVYRNVQRLKLLITELMEFRRLAEGRRQLKIVQGDLPALLTDIKNAFDYLAGEKNIRFSLEMSDDKMFVWFDPGIIEKVLFNLLSNAFKFTPPGGCIRMSLRFNRQSDELISEFYAKDYIRIEVADSGPGIPDEIRDKIFEKYYMATNRSSVEGSGIGLALVKELVTLHKGEIVINEPDKEKLGNGAAFVVKLPLGRDYYPGNITGEVYKGPDRDVLMKKTAALSPVVMAEPATRHMGRQPEKKILIVEDDPEIMQYLQNELQSEYRVLTAPDAEQALATAMGELPDLVLSDIMLPVMDGIELCKRLKSDIRTEHIPVILVTARSEEKDRLEGLETGADDFIIKPFILEELKLRIKNHILAREKLRQKFIKDFTSAPQSIADFNAKDRFVSKALQIVNNNIANSDLDVDLFVNEMGMSRAQLYRKFSAITNQTVKEFVRTVRLKKAAEMLLTESYNVSEVAYAVGFGDLPYFTRSFKAQYGINPSAWVKKYNNTPGNGNTPGDNGNSAPGRL